MSAGEWCALLAFAAGGLLQAATGYGFAVLAAPVLAAVVAPERALPSLVIVGTLVNALMVATDAYADRRAGRPRDAPDLRLSVALMAISVPGTVAGIALLLALPREALRALVAGAVILAAVARAARPTVVGVRGRETVGAGLVAGVLGGSVGFNGPPVVLLLLRRGTTPEQSRGTLAVYFAGIGVLTGLLLVAEAALDPIALTPLLLVAAVAGQVVGRGLRPLLAGHHERTSVLVLAFSGAVALASAVATLL
ncbi:hypothetical protein DSM112329_01196 [Paraconexibacter sp. AEG42_29]|uniref:Probable membrane transporter protein n=1 Tax=Paraconexibacter sp. AEG42_29 TaxID=2997339 RepID=A0AAU7ARZ0_9ACTN